MASDSSQVCLGTPSVKLEGYSARGVYKEIDGLKICKCIPTSAFPTKHANIIFNSFTDVTGPADAKSSIVFIYDAFGYSDHCFIGADYLSELTGALCIVPDLLDDAAIRPGEHSAEEMNALIAKFRAKINEFKDFPGQVVNGIKAWESKWPSVEKWGAFGLCFGGKVVALTSREGTRFTVSGQAHPS
ncbi:hypothetical protein AA313_de0203201 [Arthrobotrys entomopaga]|nr:hypothetical protein AA313_de0203201 [Arthrobotrys entomopaga]